MIAIGAMTTMSTIERSDLVRTRQALFHEATRLIGHPQIRNSVLGFLPYFVRA